MIGNVPLGFMEIVKDFYRIPIKPPHKGVETRPIHWPTEIKDSILYHDCGNKGSTS